MKGYKRILALAMVLMMMVQLLPMSVFADEIGVLKGSTFCEVKFYKADKETVIDSQYYELHSKIEEVPEAEMNTTGEDGTVYHFVKWVDAWGDTVTVGTEVYDNMDVYPEYSEENAVRITVNSVYDGTELDTFAGDYTTDEPEVKIELKEKFTVAGGKDVYAPSQIETVVPADYVSEEYYNAENGRYEVTINVEYVDADSTAVIKHVLVIWDDALGAYDYGNIIQELDSETVRGKSGLKITPKPLSDERLSAEHAVFLKNDTDIEFNNEETRTAYVYYTKESVTLTYNTDGGSYIKPKTVPFGTEVTVYECGQSIICGKEEHTHSAVPSSNPENNQGATIGCYTSKSSTSGSGCNQTTTWSWERTCNKSEHTHNSSCYSTDISSPIPTKTGYSFEGWFADAACLNPAPPSMVLDTNKTVYAKWKANTVDYSVVYLKEELDGNYSYIKTSTGQATVGMTVSGNANAGSFTNSPYYHYARSTSDYVKADSSTVVYSYYDLNTYHLKFIWDGNNIKLNFNNKFYKSGEYIIDCKFGQNIADKWPTASNFSGNNTAFDSWSGGFASKRFEVTKEMIDDTENGSTTTYKATFKNGTEQALHYMLQNPDDNEYTDEEKYYQELTASGNFSAKEIFGFTHISTPSGKKSTETINNVKHNYFYYTRNTFNIEYFYKETSLSSKTGIRFEKDIGTDEYNFIPARPAGVEEGYMFAGWYDNAECAGEPYTFSTMPASNLKLYAKYTPPEFTVRIDKNVGVETIIDQFTIAKGNVPEASHFAAPERDDGYTFLGWFEGPGDNAEPYDTAAPVTGDITIYAHWRKNEFKYQANYVDTNGNPVHASSVGNITGANVGDPYTLKALTINGYRPDAPSKVIEHLSEDINGNTVTFTYTKAQPTQYTIKYIIKNKGTEIKATETYDAAANVYQVAKSAPSLITHTDGIAYRVIENPITLVLSGNPSDNVITFVYEPYIFGKVNIKYVYCDGNNLVPINNGTKDVSDHTIDELIGHSFTVGKYAEKKSLSGYDFREYRNQDGKAVLTDGSYLVSTKNARTIYVVYWKNANYKVEHYLQDKSNISRYDLKETENNLTGRVGEKTAAQAKVYGGYTAKDFTQETIKEDGTTVVKIYYRYTGDYAYTVKFKDTDGNTIHNDISKAAKLDAVITGESEKIAIEGYSYDHANNLTITTNPDNNVITLFYTRNSHNIIYKIDGQYYANTNYKTVSAKYNDPLTLITDDMSKAGYTFSGWSGLPAAMPDHDVEVTGHYELQKTNVPYVVNYLDASDRTTIRHAAKTGMGTSNDDTIVATDEVIYIPGYNYEFADRDSMLLSHDSTLNIMNLYYSIATADYTINFYLNGTTTPVKDAVQGTGNIGDSFGPDSTEITGYTIVPGQTTSGTITAGDNIINLFYVKNSYTVTYKLDNEVVEEKSYEYGAAVPANPAKPVKTGYTVSDWDKAAPETMPAEDVVISATSSINSYTVTYKVDGVQVGDVETYEFGKVVTLRSVPTKTGHTFGGWYTDEACTENASAFNMPAENVTLYGKFTVNSYNYEIHYFYNGIEDEDVTVNKSATFDTEIVAEKLDKTGYVFDTSTPENGKINISDNQAENVINVYYKKGSFKVTYFVDGKQIGDVETVEFESDVTVKETPTKDGFAFSGWSYKSGMTGKVADFKMPGNDVEIEGTFNVNKHNVIYKITGDYFQNNNFFTLANVPFGTKLSLITDDMTKEGYTFNGWSTLPEIMPDNDVVITGTYKINSYNVTYKVDDVQVGAVETYKYGENVVIRDKYVKEGFTVSDWSITNNFNMPANDVEITAYSDINVYTYTIKFLNKLTEEAVKKQIGPKNAKFGEPIVLGADDVNIKGYYNVTENITDNLMFKMPARNVEVVFYYMPERSQGGDLPDDPDEPDDEDPNEPGDGDWGEIEFDEDGNGFIIVPIDEDAVPLAMRENMHKDAALPFIFVLTAFLTQLVYNDERKKHTKKIFELKKQLATGEKPEEDK